MISPQATDRHWSIIAWGLMDADTTTVTAAYDGEPLDRRSRRLHSLPNSSVAELTAAFVRLTGFEPIWSTFSLD